MKKDRILGSGMIFLAAVIWGLAFVAQSEGADYISSMWFTCLRNILGFAVLVPFMLVKDVRIKKHPDPDKPKPDRKKFWLGTAGCGLALCIASYLQQLGLEKGTEPGKAGFITALYIIFVPIFSIVLKKKIRPIMILCVALSTVGLYLLCVTGGSGVRASDFIVLICAVMYSVQIMMIDVISVEFDPVKFSAYQYLFCCIFAFVYAIIFEDISWQNIKDGLIPLLYAGIFSSGAAFTLQTIGQRKLNNPTIASLCMSFESVFSVIFAAIIVHQIPTLKEGIGCVIMFISVIIAQLPSKPKKAINS